MQVGHSNVVHGLSIRRIMPYIAVGIVELSKLASASRFGYYFFMILEALAEQANGDKLCTKVTLRVSK